MCEWANEGEVKQWIQRIIETDEGLSSFIDSYLGRVFSQMITDRVIRIGYRLDPSLHDFIGSDETTHRIERLVQSGRWSGEQRSAIKQFLKERNKMNPPKNP